MEAGSITLQVLAHNPQHPGALHYTIHAFDDPDHAALALPAARAYAAIAPDAPHARHMPAHIFVELGFWSEAAAACESAWQASLGSTAGGGARMVDLHSLSWLPALYTELGQRSRADMALAIYGQTMASYGRAAVPYILAVLAVVRDTDRWDRLESLLLPVVAALPNIDARYQKSKSSEAAPVPAAVRALLSVARATAAARRHELEGAKKHAADLKKAHEQAVTMAPNYVNGPYKTANRVDELHVDAEIAIAEGKVAAAEAILRQAIPLEESLTQTEGAEPWRVSSYERLGELALAAGRNQEAADDFARALDHVPGRSRALWGAAVAAERLGDGVRAADQWRALARNWSRADPDFPGLVEAQARAR
jgi:tetratricopeptide (TPR) repeat protein